MHRISYDLHIHSCLSPCGDDDMTPGNIVQLASMIGLDAIALTDHNTCKNCPSFMKQAEQAGILAIPGMELTTSEEVHVLCLFPTLEQAMSFDSYVEKSILPISNKPEFFGNQILINEADEPCGTIDTLLISATEISFNDVHPLVTSYGGIMIPAHIDKNSTSLLTNLGFIPPESAFSCAEYTSLQHVEELKRQHPYLGHCQSLCSSDAHALTDLHEATYFISVEERSVLSIIHALINPSIN